ncbi:hypothetical protein QA601_15195 [Chitinispirillales bacterium ANBcel5]|uniref:hypothetical protein n=1 Tax=Cellulosispirillum alkaliphilum TaxID=3039283 RepID=UPI002A538B75|nr:hypothetical protein [Chitinispirillales bacterium ANBcel5]
MYRKSFLFSFFLLIAIFFGCTQRPALQLDAASSIVAPLSHPQPEFKSFKGSGDIFISYQGRRNSGKADVILDSNNSFRAIFYSPFGTQIGVVEGDSVGGRVAMDGEDFYIFMDEKLGALDYTWAHSLTLSEFISFLLGKMPENGTILKSRPDSIVNESRRAKLLWYTETADVTATVLRRTETLETVEFNYTSADNKHWSVTFSAFNDGFPREITFMDDSSNYVFIRYDFISAQQVS